MALLVMRGSGATKAQRERRESLVTWDKWERKESTGHREKRGNRVTLETRETKALLVEKDRLDLMDQLEGNT